MPVSTVSWIVETKMTSTVASTEPRSPFEVYDDRDVRHLIESYPLAWVCAAGGEAASLLPLVGVYDADNKLTGLIGHFARANPLAGAFERTPRAAILFTGPQGYVSPRTAGSRDWAPTWNYVQARIEADVSVEPALTSEALDLLIDKMERGADHPWTSKELGERYERLIPMILGFRARVTSIKAKFKLGQDERPETLRAILSNIDSKDLAQWMFRFNRERLGE